MTTSASPLDIVSRMAAESAIHRLHATYIHRLDSGDFAGVADVLQHAEMDVVGNVVSGREALLASFESGLQVYDDGTPRTSHSVSNVLIDIDPSGDTASSVSYYTVHQQVEGFPLQPICTGRYIDRFERHDGEWRFVRRAVTLGLAGDLRHHVKGLNAGVLPEGQPA